MIVALLYVHKQVILLEVSPIAVSFRVVLIAIQSDRFSLPIKQIADGSTVQNQEAGHTSAFSLELAP